MKHFLEHSLACVFVVLAYSHCAEGADLAGQLLSFMDSRPDKESPCAAGEATAAGAAALTPAVRHVLCRSHGYFIGAEQRDCVVWIGGQGTEPYEQKTQQSPAFGRNSTPQPAHSWK